MSEIKVSPEYGRCTECRGLLDVNVDHKDRTKHRFCAWARGGDYAALRPYLDGSLRGVDASGQY